MACRRSNTLRQIEQGMNLPENQHDLVVVAEEDLPACWLEFQVSQGRLSRAQADQWFRWFKDRAWPDDPQEQQELKKRIETVLGNVATGQSSVVAARLLRDFQGLGRYVEKTYQGRRYIIFKGYPGLRRVFQGTRYLADNPRIVAMGIGRLGVKDSVAAGARLTIVLIGAYRIVEHLLNDEATLGRLIGTLAMDVVKIAAAWAASAAAGAAVAMIGVASTSLVVGGLIASIFAGLAASIALEAADARYGLTEKLVAQMESALAIFQDPGYFACRVQRAAIASADAVVEQLLSDARQAGANAIRRVIGPTFYRNWNLLPR